MRHVKVFIFTAATMDGGVKSNRSSAIWTKLKRVTDSFERKGDAMTFRSMNTWSVVSAILAVSSWAIWSTAAEEPGTDPHVNELNLVPVASPPSNSGVPVQLHMQMQQLQGRAELKEKALFSARPLMSLSGNIRKAAEAVRDAKDD